MLDVSNTEHLSSDLKDRTVRGGAVTFAGQGMKFLLQLVSTTVLARLLTPDDFGLVAMVTAITGFMLVFKDMGLSIATVQRSQITHAQVSTLFWINLTLGATLTVLTAGLAPILAWFYGDPRLMWVTLALAFGFLLGGLTVQHQALLRRQMRFTALATVDVVSLLIGISTAILAAWAGLGYWSLVLLQLAIPLSTAVGVWIAGGWCPGRPVRRSGVRSMLAFGGYLTGFNVVNYFARNLDKILLGRFCGAFPLGLYSKAYSLLLLPIGQIVSPVSAVAIPALSRLQAEPERFRRYYLRAIKLIAYLTMPLMVSMAVLSTDIIRLVLGEQWIGAGPIFGLLAIAAIWQPVCSTVGWVYVALAQTDRMATWGYISCPLIVLSVFLGLPWGAIGVATSYTICMCLLVYPLFAFALRHSPLTIKDVLLHLYRPLTLSVLLGLLMWVTRCLLSEAGTTTTTTILACLAAGGVAFFLTGFAWSRVKDDLWDFVETGQVLLGRH